MVFCIIALMVFAFLGIFSAKYRRYAKEAFDCVFRTVTLRPCNTEFDKKIKAKVSGKLLEKNPEIGRFVYKNFEAISLAFVVLMIASLAYSAYSIYNFFAYGNCEGPNATGECIYGEIGNVLQDENAFGCTAFPEEIHYDLNS